ncbi:MAG TPA: hypothetical protein PK542_10430 [Treponemataceae bacterium]|nr:hypothetical protein [Treponemataceae bacterium]HPS44892.1 hypothetical protein [Treponemataceae bacterium]
MMKNVVGIAVLLAFLLPLYGQSSDPVILSYQRNFIRASMSTKIELLNDASRITTVNMTPLYVDALNFSLDSWPVLGTDAQLVDLASVAATKISSYQDPSALPSVRAVFKTISDARVRVSCLNAWASLAKGQKDEIAFLNGWFSEALDVAAKGTQTDPKVLSACAAALGKIADASSFPVLFKAATLPIDSNVVLASGASLNAISDGYTDSILAIIATKRVKDMYAAFSFAMKKDSLSAQDRAKIAKAAFEAATDTVSPPADAQAQTLAALTLESMGQLTALKWSEASPSVVKYFYRVQGDFKNDRSAVDTLIPVVRCMGAMQTQEAAQALSIFLGLLNSETEQKKTYNEQLMLAVIQALGDLGDKTAFDYLLYVGYLDYPETVKKASRDALARLQW